GGDKKTYKFGWVPGTPQKYNDFVIPAKTTYYRFTANDKCNIPVKDSIHIVVRQPVKMTLTKDTTICFGRDVILKASATGGDSTKYVFRWDNGLPNGPSNKVMPNSSTFYRASVYDGCSAFGDSSQVTVFVLNPISVSLSNDTTICSNGAARIIATTSGGNVKQYKFTWTPAAANNDTIFVSPANNTTYKLNLTDGCSIATATDTVRVNVYNKLKATVLNNDTTLCFGNSIDLASTNSGGDIATITKDWNQGLSSSNNFNTKPIGTTIYKFTVTDKCAQPVFDSVIVKVLNPLSLNASKDTLICNGGVADIFAKAKGGDVKNYNFAWDNSLPNDSMHKVNPSITTTYNVVLTDGCTPASASAKIKVSVLAPLIVNAGNDTAVCTGQAIKLIASAKGGKNSNRTITWNPGNVNSDTLRNIPVLSGYYIAEVTDGCSTPDMDSLYVTVNVLPVADFTVNTILACTPASIQFTNKSTPTGSIYKWRFGDGDFSSDTDPLHDYLDKGLYKPRLTVETPQGCVDTLDFATNIEILQQPVASFIADKPTTEIDDALISFTNQSQDADRYEWTFGDTNTIFTGLNETHRYLDTGYYNVILKVFNKANCIDEDTMWVRINDIFRIFIPDAFSPNKDGHNDAFGSVMSALTAFNMEVYDRWGMKVFESNDYKKQWDGTIKDADAQTDIYVVKYTVSTLDGHTYYFKKAITLLR
ncbi:MAG: gliding motility-associated C-terminal domain-containing protein, partial [Bacteroidia bacterium]|nr:gliding motility-associated C-terminal domain-containing protein [Bacteroidia bacterium]